MSRAPRVVVDTTVVSIIHNQDDRAPYYEQQLAGHHSFISFLLECPLAAHDGDFADIPGLRLIRFA